MIKEVYDKELTYSIYPVSSKETLHIGVYTHKASSQKLVNLSVIHSGVSRTLVAIPLDDLKKFINAI